jgi:hypothetical protein
MTGSAVADRKTEVPPAPPDDATPEDKARYHDELARARAAQGLTPQGDVQPDEEQTESALAPGAPTAPPEELRITGPRKLAGGLGGKKPTHSTLSVGGLSGLKLSEGTTFENGQMVRMELIARIEAAGDKHVMDRKQGIAVDCVRQLKAHCYDIRIVGVVDSPVLEESDAAALLRRAVNALREQGLSDDAIRAVASMTSA